MKADSQIFQLILNSVSSRNRQQARHNGIRWRNNIHLIATLPQIIGKLTANQTGTHNSYPFAISQSGPKRPVIHQVINRENMLLAITINEQANDICPPGQHQLTIDQTLTTIE